MLRHLDEVIRLRTDGLTVMEIAAAIGYSHTTVSNLLDYAGIPRTRALPAPDLDVGEVIRLYGGGLNIEAVCAKVGQPPGSKYVRQALRAAGVTRHGGGLADPAVGAEVVRRYLAGQSAEEIGAEVGRSRSRVYLILRRHQVPLRMPQRAIRRPRRQPPKPYPQELADQVVDLYLKRELPMRAVARQLGVSYGTVRRWLLARGVQMRRQGAPSAPNRSPKLTSIVRPQ